MRFGDHAVLAEVADESTEITLGLMHRRRLAENAGMVFLFPFSVRTEFWMKNTLIPLSIAFLRQTGGRNFEVVSILDMEPCRLPADESDNCPLYQPTRSYDIALEVNQGWFDRAGVEAGAEAVIEGPLTGRFE